MISGTLILEDTVMTFTSNKDKVTYTVCDGMTGKQETKEVDGKDFSIALGIAINFDGEIPEQNAWSQAENVQPLDKDLRFIP